MQYFPLNNVRLLPTSALEAVQCLTYVRAQLTLASPSVTTPYLFGWGVSVVAYSACDVSDNIFHESDYVTAGVYIALFILALWSFQLAKGSSSGGRRWILWTIWATYGKILSPYDMTFNKISRATLIILRQFFLVILVLSNTCNSFRLEDICLGDRCNDKTRFIAVCTETSENLADVAMEATRILNV